MLRNDGGGAFTVVPPASIGIHHRATTGISSGDLDNDGRIDLVLIDQDRDPARRLGFDRAAYVYLNIGGGSFRFAGEVPSGRFGGFTAGLADLDNDGDLDITLPGLPYVLLNDGHAGFVPGPSYPGPQPADGCVGNDCTVPDPRTVAFADIDDDGDMDSVVTAKFGAPALVRNDLDGGRWLKVRLVSPEGQAGAFGAKLRVTRPGSAALIALREAKSGFGYLSQSDPVMHVGLGAATTVDVEVTFLDGRTVSASAVPTNRTIVVTGDGVLVPPGPPPALRSSVAGSLVLFSWDAPAEAVSGCRLEAGSTTGANDLAVFTLGTQTALAASAPDGVYYARVRALNGVAAGPPSPEAVVTVGGGCAPAAPGPLGFGLSGARVTLAWSAPAGPAEPAGYIVEAGSAPGASDLAALRTTATSLAVGAPPGRYYVRVRAMNGCGTGPASNEVVVTVP
ncbi:MAG: FG-GAP-like repeat-containing protein [Vicinamibacterales bacterium]